MIDLRQRRGGRFLIVPRVTAVCFILLKSANSFQSSRQLFAIRRNTWSSDVTGCETRDSQVFQSSSNRKDSTEDDFIDRIAVASSLYSKIDDADGNSDRNRRDFLLSTGSTCFALTSILKSNPAEAINIFNKQGLYVLNTKDELSASSMGNEQVQVFPKLSSEYALLKVLPVKNPVFRTVEQNLEQLSVLRYRRDASEDNIDKAWARAESSIDTAMSILANKRNQLEPVFNPDDSTEVAILKAERGEILLGDLNEDLEYLKESIQFKNVTCAFEKQRKALLTLGRLGELLVKEYPYKVPSKGKYSFLPRLLGRATVTFRFKRPSGTIIGDVKIVADGYTAPITAGNFIDLCIRNFYTGLPVKEANKKVAPLYQEQQENLPFNLLGTYNEGFYDPLTGQLREIPLEVILIEGTPKLTYSYSRRFSEPEFEVGEAKFVPATSTASKTLLTFEIPGLVAFNHPIGNPNGGSSEFFALQSSVSKDKNFKRSDLNGQYAPFGYIIEGFDVFDSLKPGDVIDSTTVDDFGQLNLVKIRSSTFKEVTQGTEEASSNAKTKASRVKKKDQESKE
ncbi:unnamed protein product [Pseudo-nitzschia multistriata]|uniref:peptidylprolyl isomerase n=1 Tax=Pseudo-nitzschia multistriata TaxID=183589 RepID=A0A448ZG96_9STRA|nr:unnamed protein product [Pseudo-nitzschia multistriata]